MDDTKDMFSDSRLLTIGYVAKKLAGLYGDREALTFIESGQTYSYNELEVLSSQLANGLIAAGITQGMHVALFLDNGPEIVLAYLALGKIGAVAVPVNTAARGAMLQYYLVQSDARALIITSEYVTILSSSLAEVSKVECVIEVPTGDIDTKSIAQIDVERYNFWELTRHPAQCLDIDVRYKDVALLMYTSGTTGPSKANMFSHSHMIWYALEQRYYHRITTEDVMYVTLPFFHANGLLSSLFATLLAGGRVAVARRFSASRFWHDLATVGGTITGLLGSMTNILLKQPVSDLDGNNSLRAVVAIPAGDSAREFAARFKTEIYSGYGLTDYALAAAFNDDCPIEKLGSAGRARENMEIRIVDDDDIDLPPGTVGEILLRSRKPWRTSLGYYKMPDKFLEATVNGWFHTGDLGYLDNDGYLYFSGRKKEAVRRRGENISTYEAEQIIRSHSAVADVAVFGIPSSMSEDEVAAAVVLRDGAVLSHEALVEYCIANMPYFMVPRFVRFCDDLPRNLSLKVVKTTLIEEAKKSIDAYVDFEKYITEARNRHRREPNQRMETPVSR